MSSRISRDMAELEGALLPVATEVAGQNSNANATATSSAVIPCAEAVFDYATALCNEPDNEASSNNEAVVVPDNANQLNYAGVSDDSKSTVGKAQQQGRIRSEEELESIRKANRRVHSINYHEHHSFKDANARAKQRDREGLEIRNDHIQEQLEIAERTKQEDQWNQKVQQKQKEESEGYQVKGYQIKEYDCGTYETNDYEVTEYKSVYD